MIHTEPKEYSLDSEKQELPGFDEKYVNIIDYILKITEEIWEKRAIWVIHDTYDRAVAVHTGNRSIHGIEQVVNGTLHTLSAFPDRKMKGEAVIWSMADDTHFYTSHRIGSTATNTGPSDFGEPTHEKVFFRTIADCVIRENKIVEEWLVRDNLHLVKQLGFDPIIMAKRDQRYTGNRALPSLWPSTPNTENNELDSLNVSGPVQLVQLLFEQEWKKEKVSDLTHYYHASAVVHAICEEDLKGIPQIETYLSDLFACFLDKEVTLERISANEKEGKVEVAARWKMTGTHHTDGIFGPASGKPIVLPGITHYLIEDGKILEEWMVFDAFDVMCQIYVEGEPQQEGTSGRNESIHKRNKQKVFDFITEWNQAGSVRERRDEVFQKYLHTNLQTHISRPFDSLEGIKAFETFWDSLLASYPDLEIQPYLILGGEYRGVEAVSVAGNITGTFQEDWLGIPANQQATCLRFSTQFILEKGKIIQQWIMLDILGVMHQAGYQLFPTKGVDRIAPAPATQDGLVLYETHSAESQKSVELVNAMIAGLLAYDQKDIHSMKMERFWDERHMMWYGPSGIGTTRGLSGFQQYHQIPFLTAFPNRGVIEDESLTHYINIGDGNYTCHFGHKAMKGNHSGDGWLGIPATYKDFTLSVMDFWRREGDFLVENWVMLDMVDLLEQFGIDVFEKLRQMKKAHSLHE
ncbi:MAG: ester cyclase [Bacteroidota bacterium]